MAMDSWTAFISASAIVGFLDVGLRLLHALQHILGAASGAKAYDNELRLWTAKLSTTMENLDPADSLDGIKHLSSLEVQISAQISAARKLATSLLNILDGSKDSNRFQAGAKHALLLLIGSSARRTESENLRRKLLEIQGQASFTIIRLLRDQQNSKLRRSKFRYDKWTPEELYKIGTDEVDDMIKNLLPYSSNAPEQADEE